MKSILKSIHLAAEIFTVPILVTTVIIAHMIGPGALAHRDMQRQANYSTSHGKQQPAATDLREC